MDPQGEEKTGFVTAFRHYHWRVMLFGVMNGPATFQSYMNEILGDIPNVLVYQDVILIYSHNENENKNDLKRVLEILRENKLIL